MSDHSMLVGETVGTWIIIALMIVEMIRTERHNAAVERGEVRQRRPYWPWIVMALLAVVMWIPVYLTYTGTQQQSKTKGADILVNWGTGADNGWCQGIVDGAQLAGYQDKYRIALVCGMSDPTIDRISDTRITISQLFTIQPQLIGITAPFSQTMSDAVKKNLEQAIKTRMPPAGGIVTVSWYPWYQVVLLPVGADPSDIHRLSDVSHYGGILLPDAAGGSTASVTDVAVPQGVTSPRPTPKP
jgi:hypothetical protein